MDRDNLLNTIKMYQFYAIDLNLYLDNFPCNKEAVEDYRVISDILGNLFREYEEKYGPLTNFGSAYIENPICWVEQPWPWENYICGGDN